MKVISNASPSVCLARIGQLDLLRQLYGEISIPDAVWGEIVVDGVGQPGANEVKQADWIKRRSVGNIQLILALQQELDNGEAEAIALAVESEADLLIIDERLGRDVARHFGLNISGLIAVLIEAKHKGLIDEVEGYLDKMRDVAGFRVSDELYRRVLTDEDEREKH